MAAPEVERRMAAILIADIVGYSRLIESDETGTLAALKALRREVIDPLVARHRGRIVKLMGDGILAEFPSVVAAVSCAVALQKDTALRQADVASEQHIVFRIGVNLGDVVVEEGDLLGDGVNVAARLEQLAGPGDVLISGTAYDHLQGKFDLPLDYAGEQRVKNIRRRVRAYRVNLDGKGPPWRLRLRQHSRHLGLAALVAAIVVAALAYGYGVLQPGRMPASAEAHPSLAVLPFDDMNGKPELSYFGDGVAEDIISMLSRVPDLKVVSRNSSFAYKGQPIDVRKVGKELGVTHVLEGSVRKDTDRVRIVAQLIDAKTGEHVWGERFDRSGSDPWALQDEVTEKIVVALAGDIGTLRMTQYRDAWGKDSTNLAEYDYYLRAHGLFTQLEKEPVRQAMTVAAEGLVNFPNSALLKMELGLAHFTYGFNGWSDDVMADYRKAGALVREAWAKPVLSPLERRLGHYLLAFVEMSERSFDKALVNAESAIAMAPYDAYMLAALSQISVSAGKPDQALEWLDRAASLSANPAVTQELAFYRGWALAIAGRLEDSLAALQQDRSDEIYSPLFRAIVLHRLGRAEEAKAEFGKALATNPEFTQGHWRELYFYSDPAILEREIADLATLGLPEK